MNVSYLLTFLLHINTYAIAGTPPQVAQIERAMGEWAIASNYHELFIPTRWSDAQIRFVFVHDSLEFKIRADYNEPNWFNIVGYYQEPRQIIWLLDTVPNLVNVATHEIGHWLHLYWHPGLTVHNDDMSVASIMHPLVPQTPACFPYTCGIPEADKQELCRVRGC